MIEIILIFQQLIASGTHVIAKGITEEIAPHTVLFYRSATAALVYLAWFFINKRKFKQIEKKDLWTLLLLAFLNIPLNQFLFFVSIELTTPPKVALAYALTPAFVFIIAAIFLKERATKLKLFGVILAIAGTFVVIFERGVDLSAGYFVGDLLALTASLSWAIYTVVGKNFSTKYGAIYSTGLSMIWGFFLYLPIYLILPAKTSIYAFSTINWLQILYLGVMTSGLGYALWYYALKKIEASKLSVFNNLQPIFTTIMTVIFFDFDLTITFVIGGIIIIAGVIMTQKG